jgi:AcrR family transcriptional regulator
MSNRRKENDLMTDKNQPKHNIQTEQNTLSVFEQDSAKSKASETKKPDISRVLSVKQNPTKDKILNVAEALFAEHGFTETSLRSITAGAEVNLASVNYHFGSKKILIEAVFERFMGCFTEHLSLELKLIDSERDDLSVTQVFNTLVKPLVEVDKIRPNGASIFMQIVGRAYSETQGHLRRFAMTHYAEVFKQFTHLLHKASPEIQASEMFWRLHFSLGAFIFTLAGHEALEEISLSDFQESVSVEQIINKLIPFLSAGFSAKI